MNALVFLLTEQTRRATKLGVFGAIRVRVERSDDARSMVYSRAFVCSVEKALENF